MKIGLTGTIGSGKSLVASMLEKLGATVIDTDTLARDVVLPGTTGWQALVGLWGGDILTSYQTIDRKKLADIVFADPSQRQRLNNILHPLIAQETARRIAQAPPDSHIVLVVPLLFESGFEKFVESVWVVAADEKALIQRILERDNSSRDEALSRIRAQMPQEEKIRRAQVVIHNDGSVENTEKQVLLAWNSIEKL